MYNVQTQALLCDIAIKVVAILIVMFVKTHQSSTKKDEQKSSFHIKISSDNSVMACLSDMDIQISSILNQTWVLLLLFCKFVNESKVLGPMNFLVQSLAYW